MNMKGDKLALLIFLGIVFALTGIMGAAAYSYNYPGSYYTGHYNNYYAGAYRYSYNWNYQPMPMYYGSYFSMGWYMPRYYANYYPMRYSYYPRHSYSGGYSQGPCGYGDGCW
jgi:hypothetical protein